MVIWVESKLHYKSPKEMGEERAVWQCGLGSDRESPYSKLGPVCGLQVALQIAENVDRGETRAAVWTRIEKAVARV